MSNTKKRKPVKCWKNVKTRTHSIKNCSAVCSTTIRLVTLCIVRQKKSNPNLPKAALLSENTIEKNKEIQSVAKYIQFWRLKSSSQKDSIINKRAKCGGTSAHHPSVSMPNHLLPMYTTEHLPAPCTVIRDWINQRNGKPSQANYPSYKYKLYCVCSGC